MSPIRLSRMLRRFASSRKPAAKRPKFQPALEALEDRALPSAVLAHRYELNGSLADQLGGPALVADGGTLDGQRYTFGANQGLRLEGAVADTGDYSIEVVARIDSLDPFFKKIVDFQNVVSDDGLYVAGDRLQLYPGWPGNDAVPANTDFHFALTRDGQTGDVKIYLNGVWQYTYTGPVADVVVPAQNILTFFEDDNSTGRAEAVSGSVDRILIFSGALSDPQVVGLLNQSPNLSADQAGVTVNEGQTAANRGVWNDPDGDAVSLSASVGTVTANADGTWSWSFATSNGPAQSQTVTITAVDSQGAMTSTSFSLVVNNVAPVIAALGTNRSDPERAAADGNVTLSGAFTDAGTFDTHTVTVGWGDGSAETLTVNQGARTFTGSHHYRRGGIYTATVTVTDSDGAAVSGTATAAVTGVGLKAGTLYVIGTAGNDMIDVEYVAARGSGRNRREASVYVYTRWGGGPRQTVEYVPSQVQRIVVIAGAGNDYVRIQSNVLISAIVFGGAGNDVLLGGGGGNVLVGGTGSDVLYSGRGRDILIAGSTTADVNGLSNALVAWRAGNRAAAVAALGTVIDDGVRDWLFGSRGRDLFFA